MTTSVSASSSIFNALLPNNMTPSAADNLLSTLETNASAVTPAQRNRVPYRPVDPNAYQGSWSGTFNNGQAFRFLISNVRGWQAQVRYQSGTTLQYERVLINNNSFIIGNTKFALVGNGQAQVGMVVTNPTTGANTLLTGSTAQNT